MSEAPDCEDVCVPAPYAVLENGEIELRVVTSEDEPLCFVVSRVQALELIGDLTAAVQETLVTTVPGNDTLN